MSSDPAAASSHKSVRDAWPWLVMPYCVLPEMKQPEGEVWLAQGVRSNCTPVMFS